MFKSGRKRKTTMTMQVVRRSDTDLALYSPVPQSNREFARFALLTIVISFILYLLWWAADIGSIIPTILGVPLAGIMIGFMVVSILLVLMPFATSFENPVETCVLDLETGYAVVTNRVVWRLFRPQVKRYRLQDIVAVHLRRSENNLRLDLELKHGTRIKLMEEPANASSISEIGELISDFLSIPLSIDIGGRTPIETYPAEDSNTSQE